MTITSQVRTAGPYVGNNVATVFPFAFKVFQPADVLVARATDMLQATLVLSADFTVTLNADQNATPGGFVTTFSPLASNQTLSLTSNIAALQPLSLPNGGAFFARNLEDEFDRLTILLQQQGLVGSGQTLRVPEINGVPTLPPAHQRGGTLLGFDESGNPSAVIPDAGSGTALSLLLQGGSGPGIVGFDPTLNYAVKTLGRHLADDFWNPCDFPWLAARDGTSDATAAIQACINAATAAGAGVSLPGLTFCVSGLAIPSYAHMRGAGQGKTVLKQISGANDALHLVDPGSSTTSTRGVTLEDVTLQGTVATDGFQEVIHLMFTQGASDLLVQRVTFSGFRGDGLYIGTGNERGQNPAQVRHNARVRVLDCTFDGEVKANRNGISVIDCDTLWVERSYFTRMSRADMPGCIDIEPDSGGTPNGTASVIRNINVTGCKFFDNAGQAAIAINFPNSLAAYSTPIYGITVSGCDIDNAPSYATATYGVGIMVNGTSDLTRATVAELGITFLANTVANVYSPFAVHCVRGVDFIQNRFGTSKYSAEIGDVTGVKSTYDLRFEGNEFKSLGSDNVVGGNGIVLYAGDGISFTHRNIFNSCGRADNAYNSNITLSSGGNKQNITVEDNTFISPVANSQAWDVRHDAGVLVAGTTRHARNLLIGVNGGSVNFAHDFIPPSDWQGLPLLNGWVAAGGNEAVPRFKKDDSGRVWLQGSIKAGAMTAGLSLANIPVGFRAGATLEFTTYCAGATPPLAAVQAVYSNGDLQILSIPANTLVSLNGISWQAAA